MRREGSHSSVRRGVAASLLGALAFGIAATGAWAMPSAPPPSKFKCYDHERIDDRYIVTLQPTVGDVDLWINNNLPGHMRDGIYQRYYYAFKGFAIDLLEPEQDTDLQFLQSAAVNARRIDTETTTCVDGGLEDNSVVPAADASLPWGLDRIDQRNLPLDGEYTAVDAASDGSGVRAYVIDSGVRADHTQFGGRVVSGRNFVPAQADTDTGDCDGHGTHVAGTIGAEGFGVAPDVELVPVRVFDCNGGSTASVVLAGIDWVAGQICGSLLACPPLSPPPLPAPPPPLPTVVNLSLEGDVVSDPDSAASVLNAAVSGLIRIGGADLDNDQVPDVPNIPVVVSAGNHDPLDAASESDSCQVTPANVAIAITVGASTITDKRWPNSNFGNCVDLFAPGVGVLSTSWVQSSTGNGPADQVEVRSGTSMAAPHVTGLVARLMETCGFVTPTDAETYLESNATRGVLEDVAAIPEEDSPDMLAYATPGAPAVCP